MRRSLLLVAVCVLSVFGYAADHRVPPTTVVRPPSGPIPDFQGSSIQNSASPADPVLFPNIQIINSGQQNETGIAVNPRNPNQLVAVANDFSCGTSTIRYHYSTDGGLTWRTNCLPFPGGYPYNDPFDPTVAYDSRGNCYVAFGNTRNGASGDDYQNGVYVCKSTDGGITFQTAVPVVENLQNVKAGSGGSQPFEDKYFICCDASPTSPNRDNVYVTWSHGAPAAGFVIVCSHSTDGGKTWSGMSNISRGGSPQGSVPACGPNGEVYCAWGNNSMSTTSQIMISRSEDGGTTWTAPKQVAQVQSVGTLNTSNGRLELTDKQNMRIATFPVLSVDVTNGPRKGTVYLAWQGNNNVPEAHIFMATSNDKGQNWSSARIIDQANAGLDVYMPGMACDPVTGDLTIDYYDSRNSSDNTGYDLYASQSRDGGATFSEYRITSVTTKVYTLGQGSSGGSYYGDYQGLTAYGGTAWPCWWDCRTGSNYNACHIYTAVIRSSAKPVTNLAVLTTCASPTTAQLSWTDPTETTTGQPLPSFQVEISRNGSKIATVAKGVQMFRDSNLTQGTQYVYSVVANGGPGASTPALDTITAGGGGKLNAPSAFRVRPVTGGIEAMWVNPATHVDGSEACDLQSIYFYNDTLAAPIDSVGVAPNSQGQPASRVLRLDTTKFYRIGIRAKTLQGGSATTSDSTAHLFSFAGAPRPSPSYNFDGAPVQMYTTGAWGLTTKAHSAPNALTDSPTGNSTRTKTTYAQLPPFIINARDTTITFYHVLISDATAEGAIEITTDNGVNWSVIRSYNQNQHPDIWKSTIDSSTWFKEHRSMLTGKTKTLAHVGDTASLRFRLTTTFAVRDGWYIDDVLADNSLPDAVRESSVAPVSMTLEQNYPNPFNPSTRIRFSVPRDEDVALTIVDALGRTVATLVDGRLQSGTYSSEFIADNFPSGTYFSVLRANGQMLKRAMMLVK